MRIILCFLVLLWLVGCSPSIYELSGDYACKDVSSSFALNRDSTFYFRCSRSFEYSQGTWVGYGNSKVILNSVYKDRTLPIRAMEYGAQEFGASNFVSVDINLPEEEKANYMCMIFINDTLCGTRTCDSLAAITIPSSIRSIFFRFSGDEKMAARMLDTLSTDRFFPVATMGNRLQIHVLLNDSLFNYRVFDNEVYKVTKKGLRYYDPRDNQWEYIARKKANNSLSLK